MLLKSLKFDQMCIIDEHVLGFDDSRKSTSVDINNNPRLV